MNTFDAHKISQQIIADKVIPFIMEAHNRPATSRREIDSFAKNLSSSIIEAKTDDANPLGSEMATWEIEREMWAMIVLTLDNANKLLDDERDQLIDEATVIAAFDEDNPFA